MVLGMRALRPKWPPPKIEYDAIANARLALHVSRFSSCLTSVISFVFSISFPSPALRSIPAPTTEADGNWNAMSDEVASN